MRNNAKFNQTNEKIEWARWTWNPVVGCKHGCPYCYARDIAKKIYGDFEPRFFPERLEAPFKTRVPKGKENDLEYRNVFVCSIFDRKAERISLGGRECLVLER